MAPFAALVPLRRRWRQRVQSFQRLAVLASGISVLLILFKHGFEPCQAIVPAEVLETEDWSSRLTLILSKALSAGVISGSLLGKLPQVYDVWRAKSAAGLSRVSIWMETASLGIQFAYNVVRQTPWYTYAEVPILFCQLLLLGFVAAYVDGELHMGIVTLGSFMIASTIAMATRLVPVAATLTLYAVNALMGLGIILPQIILNFRNRSTGQLSFIVTFMTFCGTSARLYTTLVGVDDLALRLTIGLNWLLLSVLMLQFAVLKPALEDELESFGVIDVDIPPKKHLQQLRSRTEISRSGSVLQALSAVGSSRCLTDLVQTHHVEDTFQRMRSFSSFGQLSASLSPGQDWRRTLSADALYSRRR
mmetsp:Transcript_11452/g.26496  ORF Transcript_11452/g.26496 Transcript_11452/m.26496 type:complete len:362 (-) Transcript_11452:110-1195(-)